MQRSLIKKLFVWKQDPRHKPAIVRGPRRVGKTWLLKEFGNQAFGQTAYVCLEDNPAMQALFEGSLKPQRILDGIAAYTNTNLDSDTLIILDEIQAAPRAITALKHFSNELPGYPIIAAGSLLGTIAYEGLPSLSGQVDIFELFPMTFSEFLIAKEHNILSKYIDAKDYDMLGVFADQLQDLLEEYCFVGGMPEAVLEHIETADYTKVNAIHRAIIDAYERDFTERLPKVIGKRCLQVWQSLSPQLLKGNKKFFYGLVQAGARGRDIEKAVQFLEESNLIYRIWRVSKPGAPLEVYRDPQAFKVFPADIGLLGVLIYQDDIPDQKPLQSEHRDVYAEQFACQELVAGCRHYLYYWSAMKSAGEIDFIYQNKGQVYPFETTAKENPKSKSLHSFCTKYDLTTGRRLSLSGYRDEGWMQNIPLYAVKTLV